MVSLSHLSADSQHQGFTRQSRIPIILPLDFQDLGGAAVAETDRNAGEPDNRMCPPEHAELVLAPITPLCLLAGDALNDHRLVCQYGQTRLAGPCGYRR